MNVARDHAHKLAGGEIPCHFNDLLLQQSENVPQNSVKLMRMD